MDADLRVITRQSTDEWINRIKLVTVTPINFTGQQHDINDITTYITNWGQNFGNGWWDWRASRFRRGEPSHPWRHPEGRTRCWTIAQRFDHDGSNSFCKPVTKNECRWWSRRVLGLGALAGASFGIDSNIRKTFGHGRAQSVGKPDGLSYKHILAVIFALPNLDKERDATTTNYQVFSRWILQIEVFWFDSRADHWPRRPSISRCDGTRWIASFGAEPQRFSYDLRSILATTEAVLCRIHGLEHIGDFWFSII